MTAEARAMARQRLERDQQGERAEKSGEGVWGICLFWLLAILNMCQIVFVLVVVGFAVIVTPNSEMCNDNAALSVFLSICVCVCLHVCALAHISVCVCIVASHIWRAAHKLALGHFCNALSCLCELQLTEIAQKI